MASTQKHASDSAVRSESSGQIEAKRKGRVAEFDATLVRDISERVYRIELERDCDGNVARMIANDGDNGEKLRNRAASYDHLTRAYLRVTAARDMLALLQELIDIEGPQPGTGEWASKVKIAIAKATGQSQGTEPVAHGNQDVQAQEPKP